MCENSKKTMVQLHSHDSASLLDGVASTKKLVEKAKSLGHPALATTNHGNPSSLFLHWKECKKSGIKPILGLEFYITNDLRGKTSHKDRNGLEDRDYHQSVYIKNKEGYKNFNYLTYVSHTDGYYYKPRIDFDLLFERKNGLLITSSCMASKMGNYIREGNEKSAKELFLKYLDEFGEDFYGEIQFNEVKGQKEINDYVIHLCNKYDVPIIIGGDVHYANPGDNVLQDALIRSKQKTESDWVIDARNLYYHDIPDYYKFNKEFGFNYSEEILEKAFENSIKFSEKINFDFETGKYHLPKIDTGELSSKEYLEKVSWEGLIKNIETERKYFPNKYSDEDLEKFEKQVEHELRVIDKLGLNDYMLIVYDIIKWEKENGIYVGPGRGSAAGSLIANCLGICSVNPVEHGLLFERFINENRAVMADIDFDSERGGREKILEYLIKKYGQECVSNVATFGTYKVKSALQAMSRGLRKDTGHDTILMKKITKLPELEDDKKIWKDGELISFFKELKTKTTDFDIKNWISENEDTIDFANRILGNITQLGTHAGGIVVTPGPIYDYIPVTKGGGNLVTAFKEADGSGKDLSELGILKLDVLGLSTLNILKECVETIKEKEGIDLSEKINYLPLDDKKMLDFFSKGNNYGIFQMERSKMFTEKIKIDSFQDIVAINAMNRPGPLEKYLNKYGYWKGIDNGTIDISVEELEKINKERYPFEFMKKTLEKTFGCLLYQEQFMQMISDVTGMTFGDSDSFRRAIAWTPDNPKYYTVKGYFDNLENSMIEKGYSKEDVEYFVKYCIDFMGYSFNFSHSFCLSGNSLVELKKTEKKKLKDIKIGEDVLTYNEKTKKNEFKKVLNFFNQGIKKVYKIKTESGKELILTNDHKIFCEDGKYYELKEILKSGIKIKTNF